MKKNVNLLTNLLFNKDPKKESTYIPRYRYVNTKHSASIKQNKKFIRKSLTSIF